MTAKHRRRFLQLVATIGTVGLAGCSESSGGDDGNGSNGDGSDGSDTSDGSDETDGDGSDTTGEEGESTDDGETSQEDGEGGIGSSSDEVSNDLTGFAVTQQSVEIGESSFSGSLTLRNVGEEEASLREHQIELRLLASDGSTVTILSSYEGDAPAPGEEATLEFFIPNSSDIDYSRIASYEFVLSCGMFDDGVYCPEG